MTQATFAERVHDLVHAWNVPHAGDALGRVTRDLQELFLADTATKDVLDLDAADRSRSYLGIIGEIGTGKGVFAEYMKTRYAALHERFSARIRTLVGRWGISESRTNLQKIAMDLRAHFGHDVLTRPILKSVLTSAQRYAVIEGIRLGGDIRDLRRLPDFRLVYVTAPIELCFARRSAAGENVGDSQKTFEDFKKDREAPNEIEIASLGATAEYRIDNVGTLEDYHRRIEEVIYDLDPVAHG